MKKFLSEKKNLTQVAAWVLILNAIIELDYLAYGFIDQFGLPRLTTILHLIVLPLLVIWAFMLYEDKKKPVLILTFSYLGILGIWFVLHCLYVVKIIPHLYLTERYVFSYVKEFLYIYTLVFPYFLMYSFFKISFDHKTRDFITHMTSWLISIPIVLGNLFTFGMSTYKGYTIKNMFIWFLPNYEKTYDPRELASKFFFEEGNTIGILLFLLLPVLYYFFAKKENSKGRTITGATILIQSLAMVMLGTKIGTYGALLTPIAFAGVYVFLLIIKQEKFKTVTLIYTLVTAGLMAALFPFSPAYVNQRIFRINDERMQEDNYLLAQMEDDYLKDGEEYEQRDHPALVYKFETYALPHGFVYPQIKQGANLLGNTPYEYIFDWYPYTFDAKFWLDEFLFGTPPEKRVNGRQFQQIFMNYKMGEVDWQSIWLGLGYSEFEAGSILLEEDFVSQVYNLGVFGEVLTVVPYIGVLLWGVYEVLRRWKKLLTLEVSCYAMSFVFALASGYISGHTLDQFTTTMFIALSVSVLLSRIQEAKHD